jgi:bacteriocin-like protein
MRMKIPDNLNITILEENAQTFYLILPAKINPETEDELTEAELMNVSGGQNETLEFCYVNGYGG